MRKLECNKEEMSKIVVDPLKTKEDNLRKDDNLREELEIQKEKQARLEEESRRLDTITEEERRKKEKQKEETHRLQKEEKEKRRKEASKAQKEKTSIFYFGDLFQQRKAKNDLQTQEAEVGFYELNGHRVSLTNDQWIQIFIIKLLMCGIPLLAKFPPYHMRLFALANKDIYLSSHNHH